MTKKSVKKTTNTICVSLIALADHNNHLQLPTWLVFKWEKKGFLTGWLLDQVRTPGNAESLCGGTHVGCFFFFLLRPSRKKNTAAFE